MGGRKKTQAGRTKENIPVKGGGKYGDEKDNVKVRQKNTVEWRKEKLQGQAKSLFRIML